MDIVFGVLSEIDWKTVFAGLALIVSLVSLYQSNENAQRDKKHKVVEQKLKENQLTIGIDSKLHQAWDLMGGDIETQTLSFASRANLNQAKRLINQCILLNPNHAPSHRHLGLYYVGMWLKNKSTNDQYKAEKAFRNAIKLDSEYVTAYNNLGNLLSDMNRHEEAEILYQEALRIEPDYASALNNLGNLLSRLGRFGEAETFYREAIKLEPESPHAYNGLGNVLSDTQRTKEAEQFYQKAIDIDPGYDSAHFNLKTLSSSPK